MAQPALARVVSTLRASARRKTDVPNGDRDLLTRFVKHRDEAAFRALVHRHGPVVLTACRQVLSDPADIDDAFQATFLVLLKKAKSVDAAAPLGGWLFAVAHRVAVRCRADNARRRAREAEAARRQSVAADLPDVSWREAAAVLHDELNALPDKYRLPILLCVVQGLTRDEAAEQLGTTVGAVRGQLERGRTLLERRLTKRGIVLSAGLLAVLMGNSRAAGGPSAELVDRAVRLVGGHASAAASAFARGAFPVTTLKQTILPAVLVFGLIGAGLGLGSHSPGATADGKPEEPKTDARREPKGPKKPEAKERTIAGKVVGPDGQPVPAELHLIRIGGQPESLGKTNGDGTFRVTVPLVEPGAYLVAKADGYGIDFIMPATNTPNDVTFKLPKDHPIRGRVIDTQGKPVAGAVVTPLYLFAFADGSANGFLATWKTRRPQSGAPGGSNNIWLYGGDTGFTLPDGRMLLAAKTGADGTFEIGGIGAERVVNLFVRGAGVADTEVYVVNREKFDPNPVNLAAADNSERMMPKGMGNFGRAARLHGPNPTVITEQEKVIRGTVRDRDTGKPRADVEVVFLRVSNHELLHQGHRAKTGKDGTFEIRGSRKHETYVLETYGDPDTGYMPCQVEAKDTVGYEPIAVEIGCAKGVVVSGTMTDKATGKPLAAFVYAEPLHDNEFVKKYPTMNRSASSSAKQNFGGPDGRFRLVTVPGRVLLMAGPSGPDNRFSYKPPHPDPKFPKYFHRELGSLTCDTAGGGRSFVQGNWCKVLEIKEGESGVVQDIEFEPAARTSVRVVDADDKPVAGCEAAGLGWQNFSHPIPQPTATATAYGIEPKEERLIAIGHRDRRLVGTAVVKADDADPVVKLGKGGAVSGRVVDKSGAPIEGVLVLLHFEQREVEEMYKRMHPAEPVVSDAKGQFRFDAVPPGSPFRFAFSKGKKNFGPDDSVGPKHTIEKHGETKDLGDLKLKPLSADGEE